MLSIWSSSFSSKKKRGWGRGKLQEGKEEYSKKKGRKENEGLKRSTFYMSVYKGKYIGLSPFSYAKTVWHASE